tara:strand:- start:27348 stop:27929 length:582 start_codon:yes stop_codon:yes gene_type:complete
MNEEVQPTAEDKKTKKHRKDFADAWKSMVADEGVSVNKSAAIRYKLFLTLTPYNPNDGVRKLIEDGNALLTMLMGTLHPNCAPLVGYVAIEHQKLRCGHYVPHLHFMLGSPKKGINSVSDRKLHNRILTIACDTDTPLFNRKGIDVQRIYSKSELYEYITKTSTHNQNGHDFLTPLNANGLMDINLVMMGAKL